MTEGVRLFGLVCEVPGERVRDGAGWWVRVCESVQSESLREGVCVCASQSVCVLESWCRGCVVSEFRATAITKLYVRVCVRRHRTGHVWLCSIYWT
jgi:hypothetical protein